MQRPPNEFVIPAGLKGKFGIVKLWPGVKAAEDEIIERIRRTAGALGLECLVVDFKGRAIENSAYTYSRDDLDFIIHLHFETPKCYDFFSFVALWNPLQFYHEWGYRRFTAHLSTHDDFLSCASPWADDHAIRRVRSRNSGHLDPSLYLFHSLSEPIFEPTVLTPASKLFYAGINWDKLKGKSRHEGILKRLDEAGLVRIHGPIIFQGVRVWEGFQGYDGPIPFDGESMIAAIAKAGISLVFSSEAHKESGLMSARLFESAAAGAVIIADENRFVRQHFGDSVLYVDSSLPVDDLYHAVRNHLAWISGFPEEALTLARASQAIFLEKFSLDRSLAQIYEAFPERREILRARPSGEPITLVLLIPEYSAEVVARHVRSMRAQEYEQVTFVVVANLSEQAFAAEPLRKAFDSLGAVEVRFVAFENRNSAGQVVSKVRLGEVVARVLSQCNTDLLCIVAPHESLYSDHLGRLAEAMDRSPKALAVSDVLLCHRHDNKDHIDLYDRMNISVSLTSEPVGFGRVLLRRSMQPETIPSVLPYLDSLCFHALAATGSAERSFRATIEVDIQDDWWVRQSASDAKKEWEILEDVIPGGDFPAIRNQPQGTVASQDRDQEDIEQLIRSLPDPMAKRVARRLFAALPLWDVLKRPFETISRLLARRKQA